MLSRRSRRAWVVSPSIDALRDGIEVIEGERESKSMDADLFDIDLPDGAIVYGAATDLGEWDHGHEIAMQATAAVFALGEDDGELFAMLSIETANEDDAASLVDIVQGAMALGRLMASEDDDLAQLIKMTRGLTVRAKGRRVKAEFRHDVDDVVELLQEHGDA